MCEHTCWLVTNHTSGREAAYWMNWRSSCTRVGSDSRPAGEVGRAQAEHVDLLLAACSAYGSVNRLVSGGAGAGTWGWGVAVRAWGSIHTAAMQQSGLQLSSCAALPSPPAWKNRPSGARLPARRHSSCRGGQAAWGDIWARAWHAQAV